jgi:hypothetical protein
LQRRPCKTHLCSKAVSVIMVLSMADFLCDFADIESKGSAILRELSEIAASN